MWIKSYNNLTMNKFWLSSNLSGQNYSLAKDIADVRATMSFYSAHRLVIAAQTSNVSWDISETHIGFNIRVRLSRQAIIWVTIESHIDISFSFRVDQFNKQTIFWVVVVGRNRVSLNSRVDHLSKQIISWVIIESHIGFSFSKRVDQFNKQTIFWIIILSRFDFSYSIFSIRVD